MPRVFNPCPIGLPIGIWGAPGYGLCIRSGIWQHGVISWCRVPGRDSMGSWSLILAHRTGQWWHGALQPHLGVWGWTEAAQRPWDLILVFGSRKGWCKALGPNPSTWSWVVGWVGPMGLTQMHKCSAGLDPGAYCPSQPMNQLHSIHLGHRAKMLSTRDIYH